MSPLFLNRAQDAKLKAQKNKGLELARLEQERKNVLDLNIVVGVDSSGSINSSMFSSFMQQLQLIKGMSRIKVIEVSDIIEAVYDFEVGTRKPVVRLLGGGGNGEHVFFLMLKK